MSVKIMGAVFDADLEPHLKLVLLAYADRASHDGGGVYPSNGLVAWQTGYSSRQIQRHKRTLLDLGILELVGQKQMGPHLWLPEYQVIVEKLPTRPAWGVTPEVGDDVEDIGGDDVEDVGVSSVSWGSRLPCHTNRQLTVSLKETEKEDALQEFFGGPATKEPERDTRTLEEKKADLAKLAGEDALEATVRAADKLRSHINGLEKLEDRLLHAWADRYEFEVMRIPPIERESIAETLVSFGKGYNLEDDSHVCVLEILLDPDGDYGFQNEKHWMRPSSPSFREAFKAEAKRWVSTGGKRVVRIEGKPTHAVMK
jgi:hypothetical protein